MLSERSGSLYILTQRRSLLSCCGFRDQPKAAARATGLSFHSLCQGVFVCFLSAERRSRSAERDLVRSSSFKRFGKRANDTGDEKNRMKWGDAETLKQRGRSIRLHSSISTAFRLHDRALGQLPPPSHTEPSNA